MICTTRGRVVYYRKPHIFTYKDCIRIVKKIEAPGFFDFKERLQLLELLVHVISKMNRFEGLVDAITMESELSLLRKVFGGIETFVAGFGHVSW